MNDYFLLIYPITIIVLLFVGCKYRPGNSFADGSWSLGQAKSMQAFAALMIILHHMVQTISKYGDEYCGPITIWNSFGILFTSIFFFFSGFGLYKSYKNKKNYLDGFLTGRLPRLLIPFMLTNILYLMVLSFGRVFTLRHVFTSILGITLINTNAWFMVEIIILYIAFYICFRKNDSEAKALRLITLITIILVLISLLLGHDRTEINGHWFMGEWWYNVTLIFPIGMLVARYEAKIKTFAYKYYSEVLPFSIFLLIGCFFYEEYILDTIGYYQEWTGHPGIAAKLITLPCQVLLCLIFMWVVLLINLKLEFGNRVLKFLGGISLEIYLIHDIFRQSIYSKDYMPNIEYFALVFILSIVAAWFLSMLDSRIYDFYESNSKTFLHLEKYKEDPDLPYESRAKLKKHHRIIRAIQAFYFVTIIGMIITEAVHLYDITIVHKNRFASEVSSLKEAQVSDRVYFGKWLLDYKNGKNEAIPWIVLDKDDDHMLLLSEYVLANFSYNDHHQSVTWKDSKLCRILNLYFYNEAFSRDERRLLCGRKPQDGSSWTADERQAYEYYINKEGEYDEEDVIVHKDLVTLLTYDEVTRYMSDMSDMQAYASPVAKDQGIGNFNKDYIAPWWICTEGSNPYSAMYVEADGKIDESGKTINNSGMGVRPAIWINLSQ